MSEGGRLMGVGAGGREGHLITSGRQADGLPAPQLKKNKKVL